MQSLTLFYLFPAIAFAIFGVTWLVNRSPGFLGLIPSASCYAACATILCLGGCQQKAHVVLTAVEIDLGPEESPREIMIGGLPEEHLTQPPPAFAIPGYPYDALRLRREGDRLRLVPGSGYDSSIVVQSGETILPLTEEGPELYHLRGGDQIRIGGQSGAMSWVLGKGANQLTPSGGRVPRWIGRNGTGIAAMPLLPDSTLSVAIREDKPETLILRRGPGFPANGIVRFDGVALPPQEEWQLPYREGASRLEISRPDGLSGTARVDLSLIGATLHWQSEQIERVANLVQTSILSEAGTATLGGGIDDQIRVLGLPKGCFEITLNPDGNLAIRLSPSVAARIENSEDLHTDQRIPSQLLEFRDGIVLEGDAQWQPSAPSSPFGGTLRFQPVQAGEQIPSPESVDEEGEAPPPVAATIPRAVRLLWLGNPRTEWQLPNRKVILPMFPDSPLSLLTRRNWRQAAYPLKRMSPFPSLVTSSLFSGLQNEEINSLTLLATDPGISVFRDGKPLESQAHASGIGLLEPDAAISFLQLATSAPGLQPSHEDLSLADITRLATRERFKTFRLETRPMGKTSRQILKVDFFTPEVQSIPMGEIKRGKKREEAPNRSVSFGVNEVAGFSTEPYQVRFRALTPYFQKANATIDLNRKIEARDDYRTMEADYDTDFTIGESERLHLRVTKRSVPLSSLFLLVPGGLLALIVLLRHRDSLAWNALVFGVAYLTCSRLLFSHAAMVNFPHDFGSHTFAQIAVVALPLLLLGLACILPLFLPGRADRFLQGWKNGAPFPTLVGLAVLVFLLRLLLLASGFKESISLGGTRLSLSIFMVPFHLILFALGCARFFAEHRRIGAFDLSLTLRFFGFVTVVLLLQFATAFLVSDVGLFLYMIPQVLVAALIGGGIVVECAALLRNPKEDPLEVLSRGATAFFLIFPLAFMIWVFSAPKALYSVPFLSNILASENDIATGSTELRLLQFIDEDHLIELGTDTAERIAQDHTIMENYARRGLRGEGYLQVNVIEAKRNTALNDNVSAIYIFAQFGVPAALAVMTAYLAVLLSSLAAARHRNPAVGWTTCLAGLTFALPSIYMIAANYGFLPFTGRNMYLLGLDSGSDLLESASLLCLLALGLVYAPRSEKNESIPENA
jgi:hypothetical protein